MRILAEGLEHNSRVRHVFVHGNGRIEGLGMVADAGAPDADAERDDSTVCESNGRAVACMCHR